MDMNCISSESLLRLIKRTQYLGAAPQLHSTERDIAAKDGNGETALYKAAYGGHEAVVQLLLEKGANVNAPGEQCPESSILKWP
jgi:ankyrin repeat protein